jgi:hypothetical protein
MTDKNSDVDEIAALQHLLAFVGFHGGHLTIIAACIFGQAFVYTV